MAVIVDSSVWIEYLQGMPSVFIDESINESRIVLPPLVLSELMSGKAKAGYEKYFVALLDTLRLHHCPRSHWMDVGVLRQKLSQKGFTVTISDAHIAQCALDSGSVLFSFDKIFEKISPLCGLKLFKI